MALNRGRGLLLQAGIDFDDRTGDIKSTFAVVAAGEGDTDSLDVELQPSRLPPQSRKGE